MPKIIFDTDLGSDPDDLFALLFLLRLGKNIDLLVTGDEFDGKVTRMFDFGAMVEYLPGQEGLVHVSEIPSKERLRHPSDVLKAGQVVHVRVKNIDDYGRINLTMKK